MAGTRSSEPWPPADRDVIPDAPARLPGKPPRLRREQPDAIWRLHKEADPNRPRRYPRGRWRFDAPNGEYLVTYGNVSKHHAFAEVFGDVDGPQIIEGASGRRLSCATFKRPLQIVDLGDARVLRALRLDLRVSTTIDYARTMRWSERLHAWLPDADGIRYLGRKGGREDNYCLFLDRCADALEWTFHGDLAANEELVLEVGEMFELAFDFTVRKASDTPPPRWP